MTTRDIPKATWDEEIMDTTFYYRYPEGSNIINKGLYKNLYVIPEGSPLTPEDASDIADLMIYEGDYYYRDHETGNWVKIKLGPIPVRYDNIYTKVEFDKMVYDLYFVGPESVWEQDEKQDEYLVAEVLPDGTQGNS